MVVFCQQTLTWVLVESCDIPIKSVHFTPTLNKARFSFCLFLLLLLLLPIFFSASNVKIVFIIVVRRGAWNESRFRSVRCRTGRWRTLTGRNVQTLTPWKLYIREKKNKKRNALVTTIVKKANMFGWKEKKEENKESRSNYPSSGHLGAVVGIALQHERKIRLRACGHVGVGCCSNACAAVGHAPAIESRLPCHLNIERQIVGMQFPFVFVARDVANLQNQHKQLKNLSHKKMDAEMKVYLVDGKTLDTFVVAVTTKQKFNQIIDSSPFGYQQTFVLRLHLKRNY